MTKAYPLQWPTGWKRTEFAQRERARFNKGEWHYASNRENGSQPSWLQKRDLTINDGTQRVLNALRILGVEEGDSIISTNLQPRLDGRPRSGQSEPADPGVAVYWERAGDKSAKCMAIDRYDRVADNLAAVAATLEAMRAIERHGGAQILDRAFTGFTALPAPGQTSVKGWREVLGFEADAIPTHAEVLERYRRRRSEVHPDKGAENADAWHAVQTAYELARAELLA
jgi:hypothetical protein